MTDEIQGLHRCGIVALVGAPNTGKSTLLNALLGQKIAIVAPKPQTTRLSVRGILTRPGWQAVLVDTPGLMEPHNLLEKGMQKSAHDALQDADLVLYLASCDVPASRTPPSLDPAKTMAVINKIDSADVHKLAALRAVLEPLFPRHLEISALRRKKFEELEAMIAAGLPEGPALFPPDEVTDMTLRQAAAEIIREKALMFTQEEVPHSLAVEIDEYKEREDGLHSITATLYVERESQKGIVIGAKGSVLKRIGTAARLDLEKMAEAKVFLKLWVKVAGDWKKNAAFLKRIGY